MTASGQVAFAARSAHGWIVDASDARLRRRIREALRRPVLAPHTHTEPDGERVFEGWSEIDSRDPRYPTLFVLQLDRVGLDDLSADIVDREPIAPAPTLAATHGSR
jgi:hypothetical protein